MTVEIDTLQAIDSTTWRLSWLSDQTNPTFKVYQDGLQIDTTGATSKVFSVSPGESLVVEIIDDDSEPQQAFPGRFLLGWYSVKDTARYRIDEKIGETWTQRTSIMENGQGFYTWKSRFLEDSTEHYFRLVPIGTNGNQGDALNLSEFMVRHPSPPNQNYSYNPTTREVTINA